MFAKTVFLFLQLFLVVFCFPKPDKPCKVSDQECITKLITNIFLGAQNADTSLGFESIDPMHHDVIVASLPSVNFTVKDSTVKGLKDMKVLSGRVSDHASVYINLMLPRYEMSGMYEVNGNFMNSPITGSGSYNVKGNDIKIEMEAMKSFYKKGDVVHMRIKDFTFTTELVGKLTLSADNLFNGNKDLADSVLKLINSNDKVLAGVWSPPITKANFEKIFININKILEEVSLNDIAEDYPVKFD